MITNHFSALSVSIVGMLALASCSGGGGGGEQAHPQDKAPASLNGWALIFDRLDGGTSLQDVEVLILSSTSGLVSLHPGKNYSSGLEFQYRRDENSNQGRLVVTESGEDYFTLTMTIVFDEYHVQEGGVGSTVIGHLSYWSFVSRSGINISGMSGRVTGRRQQ